MEIEHNHHNGLSDALVCVRLIEYVKRMYQVYDVIDLFNDLSLLFGKFNENEYKKKEKAIKKLPALVKKQGVNNVLIVTDKGLMGLHLLDSMFEELSVQDVRLAELMLSTAQSTYPLVNKAYIKKYLLLY